MVEQEAVNFEVASSSLAGGAIFLYKKTADSDLRFAPGRVWPGEPFFYAKRQQTRTYASLRGKSHRTLDFLPQV